jgi:hypothetical protein
MDRAPSHARDGQMRSAFTRSLETLCESCHGAVAASLVDEEGEAVDLVSAPHVWGDGPDADRLGGYTIKLIAAHFQIVLRHAGEDQRHPVRQLRIRAERYGFVLKSLQEGYALLMLCRPDALYTVSSRALRQVEVELALEAGWDIPEPHTLFWRRAMVRLDARRHPQVLRFAAGLDGSDDQNAEHWRPVVSHGPAEEISGFERAFSVTLEGMAAPVRLVREPTGYWYVGLEPHG